MSMCLFDYFGGGPTTKGSEERVMTISVSEPDTVSTELMQMYGDGTASSECDSMAIRNQPNATLDSKCLVGSRDAI